MPCSEKRARLLLEAGRARVHRVKPFTIRLVDREQKDSALQPVRVKVDPGSKVTGIALVRESETADPETGEVKRDIWTPPAVASASSTAGAAGSGLRRYIRPRNASVDAGP